MKSALQLSRRERQIMEIVYTCGEATASQVLQLMDDAPSRTAVRTFLRILEEKGHLRHRRHRREFIYSPRTPRAKMGKSMLRQVLETFFGGSLEQALAIHLADPTTELDHAACKRLRAVIEEARKTRNHV